MTEGRADLSNWCEPQALIETGALDKSLGTPELRIVDCTTWLKPAEPGDDAPYRVVPGRAEYDAAHIPGAVFLDIQGAISDPDTRLRFMAPTAERFADAMGGLGIGDESRVVLYSAGSIMWATRVWWMLRAFGFDRAAVLDGGWEKWKAEGRPVSSAPGEYPPARFTAQPLPGRFVDREYVRSRLGDADTAMVNALAPEFHLGEGPSRYGRPGRIPGSVNVPAAEPPRSVERRLRAVGRRPAASRGRRDHPGPPGRRLLRRRHLRHRRPLSPAPARLPRPHPLRRVDGRMGVRSRPPNRDGHGRDLMTLEFHKLHPHFAAEASAVDLCGVHDDETLERIRAGMDEHAVLVFRDQAFSSEEQRDFAVRLDGELHRKTGIGVLQKSRFGDEALTDVSNVGEDGEVLEANSRKRQYGIANRLWHTDASFQDPRGRYSMLAALVLPPVSADTEFADMRAAYDTLAEETKAGLEGLRVHHSIAYSRVTLGFEFSEEESERLKGAIQPLVLSNPRTGRRSLYLASHASRILDRPVPDGRLLLRDLMEHATGPELVYRHSWRSGDFAIWDNRATMHRARPFDDTQHRREMRRVTTLDTGDPARIAQPV